MIQKKEEKKRERKLNGNSFRPKWSFVKSVPGRAAVVVADRAALLDDAQVVVVAAGPRRLQQEGVHDAALGSI
jgi:hypothetical protein